MAIKAPGVKFRNYRLLRRGKGKRELVAILSLTAMVDMFTVLVIFLLQNYNITGVTIFIPKEVTLPKAEKVEEVKPSLVVTVSSKEILFDRTAVVSYQEVKESENWMIPSLAEKVKIGLSQAKLEYEEKLKQQLKQLVESNTTNSNNTPAWNRLTVQADKDIDFLTIKKVLYTVSEAGVGEINFAVNKESKKN